MASASDANAKLRAARARAAAVTCHALAALVVAVVLGAVHSARTAADARPTPASDDEVRQADVLLSSFLRQVHETHAESLAMLVRQPSVSDTEGLSDEARKATLACHDILKSRFPRTHETLRRDVVADLSLLYTWQGADASLEPVLLVAHLDVVPAGPDQASQWAHPPFSGHVDANGTVWGRGTLDVKGRVVAQLMAIEHLLENNVKQPKRTILLAYGHDEEVGGRQGAGAIAQLLKTRYPSGIAAVIDEGGAVTRGGVPGLQMEGAMVGTAEKGYANIVITATSRGGHAAWPPREGTPATTLSQAIAALQRSPMPPHLPEPGLQMLERCAPLVAEPFRTLFAHARAAPVAYALARVFPAFTDKSAALVRSTMPVTRLEAGEKDNVVPAEATAVVNTRILPGDSLDKVVAHITGVVSPYGVRVSVMEDRGNSFPVTAPSPISAASGFFWDAVERAFHRVYGFREIVVLPFVMLGGTDSKHYVDHAGAVYRLGQRLSASAIATVHGVDERETAEGLAEQAAWTVHFLKLSCL